MNNKYTITFKGKQSNINVTAEYGENGVLRALRIEEEDLSVDAVAFCYMRVPYIEDELPRMILEPNVPITYEPVPKNLSFNTFYEAYDYKIGDKTRAMKLWTALTEADRIKCLRSIRQYNQYLAQKPNVERLYPETYLKQERFRNEFKLK